jgi:microcystin-dependent protein
VSEPFLSEIKIVTWNFPPRGWAFCNGQLLPINQNQALFSVLGTTYGGDGRQTFALPNLQGRTAIHNGQGFTLGQLGGEQTHTLTVGEMPAHTHAAHATSSASNSFEPTNNYLGAAKDMYGPAVHLTAIGPSTVSTIGGGQAHNNMQPYLVLNFVIALQGIFPSQN